MSSTRAASPEARAQTYYPSIDGLRAVAVGSVVLFHAVGIPAAGFIGVDIFFVISGFVVSLSMASAPKGDFKSFATFFYARRFIRIVPALVVCLLATFLAYCLLVPKVWLSEANLDTGLAALFGYSNYVLAHAETDYFSPGAELNPFTHTWSLGVEEQFYVVFPVLMYLYLRARDHSRLHRGIWLAVLVSGAASLALSAWWTWAWRPFAFYLAPARFWELGCGVALFMSLSAWRPKIERMRRTWVSTMVVGATLGLVASMFLVSEGSFPFPSAIAPVACTLVLLAAGIARTDHVLTGLFSSPIAVYVGRISYSLYLWHWPVFVLMRWTVGIDQPAMKALAVLLSLTLASLSYHCLETPARRSKIARQAPRWQVVVAGLALVGTAAGLATLMIDNQARISLSVTRNPDVWMAKEITSLSAGPPGCDVVSTSRPIEGGVILSLVPQRCTGSASSARLFVAGDSHALAYRPMLRVVAMRSGHVVQIMSKAGCHFFGLQQPMATATAYCRNFFTASVRELNEQLRPGDILFLPALRVPTFTDKWGLPAAPAEKSSTDAERQAAVAEAGHLLGPLAARGVKVVFAAPLPVFKSPPFRCSDWFNAMNPICEGGFSVGRAEMDNVRAPALRSINDVVLRTPNATLWDPLPNLCSSTVCSAFDKGRPLFSDADHLSELGNFVVLDSFSGHLTALHFMTM